MRRPNCLDLGAGTQHECPLPAVCRWGSFVTQSASASMNTARRRLPVFRKISGRTGQSKVRCVPNSFLVGSDLVHRSSTSPTEPELTARTPLHGARTLFQHRPPCQYGSSLPEIFRQTGPNRTQTFMQAPLLSAINTFRFGNRSRGIACGDQDGLCFAYWVP